MTSPVLPIEWKTTTWTGSPVPIIFHSTPLQERPPPIESPDLSKIPMSLDQQISILADRLSQICLMD